MYLTILGNNGPFPAPDGACSSYLLESDSAETVSYTHLLVLPVGLFPDRLEFAGEDRPHAFDLFQRACGFALLARYAKQAADVLEALLHPLTPFGYSSAIRLPSSGREWAFVYVTSVHPRHAIAVSGRNACLSP